MSCWPNKSAKKESNYFSVFFFFPFELSGVIRRESVNMSLRFFQEFWLYTNCYFHSCSIIIFGKLYSWTMKEVLFGRREGNWDVGNSFEKFAFWFYFCTSFYYCYELKYISSRHLPLFCFYLAAGFLYKKFQFNLNRCTLSS